LCKLETEKKLNKTVQQNNLNATTLKKIYDHYNWSDTQKINEAIQVKCWAI